MFKTIFSPSGTFISLTAPVALRLALLALSLGGVLIALVSPELAHACSLTGGGCGG